MFTFQGEGSQSWHASLVAEIPEGHSHHYENAQSMPETWKYDSTIKHQTVVQEEQMQLRHLQKTVNGGGESKKSLWTGTDCLQSL